MNRESIFVMRKILLAFAFVLPLLTTMQAIRAGPVCLYS
jgi:hypothetical protein